MGHRPNRYPLLRTVSRLLNLNDRHHAQNDFNNDGNDMEFDQVDGVKHCSLHGITRNSEGCFVIEKEKPMRNEEIKTTNSHLSNFEDKAVGSLSHFQRPMSDNEGQLARYSYLIPEGMRKTDLPKQFLLTHSPGLHGYNQACPPPLWPGNDDNYPQSYATDQVDHPVSTSMQQPMQMIPGKKDICVPNLIISKSIQNLENRRDSVANPANKRYSLSQMDSSLPHGESSLSAKVFLKHDNLSNFSQRSHKFQSLPQLQNSGDLNDELIKIKYHGSEFTGSHPVLASRKYYNRYPEPMSYSEKRQWLRKHHTINAPRSYSTPQIIPKELNAVPVEERAQSYEKQINLRTRMSKSESDTDKRSSCTSQYERLEFLLEEFRAYRKHQEHFKGAQSGKVKCAWDETEI